MYNRYNNGAALWFIKKSLETHGSTLSRLDSARLTFGELATSFAQLRCTVSISIILRTYLVMQYEVLVVVYSTVHTRTRGTSYVVYKKYGYTISV